MAADNKILAKIQKLLALATSSNENEAKAAAAKAEELLVLHNLEIQEVRAAVLDYEEIRLPFRHRASTESKFISNIIAKYFFVTVVASRKVNLATQYKLIGEKTNVRVAAFVYEFLEKKFYECWREYKKTTFCGEASRQPYYMGLLTGLEEQLIAARSRVENDRALILVADPGLEKAVARFCGPLSSHSLYVRNDDDEAHAAGHERGKKLHIAKGLDGPSENNGRLLK